MTSLALALLAEVVVARYCTDGLNYCGKSLNSIGRYYPVSRNDDNHEGTERAQLISDNRRLPERHGKSVFRHRGILQRRRGEQYAVQVRVRGCFQQDLREGGVQD
jgi:hypothetical protein